MPYLNTAEVESALQALVAAYPSTCHLITLPNNTHEGRTSRAVRIGLGALDSRPGILFIGGQHAREWGSPDICINFIADILEAYDANAGLAYGGASYSAASIKELVEDLQVFVFPCVNPDGRHHSMTVDPGWRGNRNPVAMVDPNRNYDFLWDFNTTMSSTAGVSVSDVPGSQTYHGTAPFSEPETQNVKWLLDNFPSIGWMIDIHSFSELLYHNWGDDQNQVTNPSQNFLNPAFDGQRGHQDDAYGEYIPSGDLGAQCRQVQEMRKALQAVRGKTYQTGQSFSLYPTTGTATDYPFSRHRADPALGKVHGFLIEWGTTFQPMYAEMENIIRDVSSALVRFCEVALEDCSGLDVTLTTMNLQFNDVPEGETTFRAVTFDVTACCDVTFEIVDGPDVVAPSAAGTAFDTPLGITDTAPAALASVSHARLWIGYTATSEGDTANGTVTVRCVQTNQSWNVPISANVIARPTAAIALVLDQSGSMGSASGIGPGISRADVLRFSLAPFIDVIEEGNAVALVRFDDEISPQGLPLTQIDTIADRLTANAAIASYAHNPDGATAIGEGVAAGRDRLSGAGGYDVNAIVVLTDGRENRERYISEVSDMIDSHVFAIGLGTPEQLWPDRLAQLCDGHKGYLLMSGALDADAMFRLVKFYQQILAGVTNTDIVLDPEGSLKPGQEHVIEYSWSEADISGDVLLFSPMPQVFRLRLITPAGDAITPSQAAFDPAIDYRGGDFSRLYRLNLPVGSFGEPAHAGNWKAQLSIDEKLWHRYFGQIREAAASSSLYDTIAAHGVPYSLIARAYSNLRMRARLDQSHREPGADLTVMATLSEYGVPVAERASLHARLTRPDGSATVLSLTEIEPGRFSASVVAAQSGVYAFRLIATGTTLRGTPFRREQLLTGAVWAGGNTPLPRPDDEGGGATLKCACETLDCLLEARSVQGLLKRLELDPRELQRCLAACCAGEDGKEGGPGNLQAETIDIAKASSARAPQHLLDLKALKPK